MMMKRGHEKDPLAAAHLEIPDLEDDGKGLHHKNTADNDQEKFLFGDDRHHAQGAPQGQGADIAHEDLRRVAVKPEKTETGADNGPAEYRHLTGRRVQRGSAGNWRRWHYRQYTKK